MNQLFAWIPRFVHWLGGFVEDGRTGKPSLKRVTAAMTATALSVGALALLLAKAWHVLHHGGDVSAELVAVAAPLCVLAGYNYVHGKKVETERGNSSDPAP